MPVKLVGKTFYETVADARVCYQVVAEAANGIYRCVSKDEDYGGTVLKSKAQLQLILKHEKMLKAIDKESEEYVESLNVGDVVHYHDGFNIFFRCEVVDSDKLWFGRKIALKQLALVGTVRDFDLPRVMNGEVYIPHMSRGILEGHTFTPHPSNIYEKNPDHFRENPYELSEVEIVIPELTEEDKRISQIGEAFTEARELMNKPSEENLKAVLEILNEVRE